MSDLSIVEEIKKLCYSQGASIGMNQHSEFIMNLEYLLRKHNYRVENGYHLLYYHKTLRTGIVRKEHGIIDLLACGSNHKIAIEYDSELSLKYKSIEKLLQSNADVLIGIVGNGTLNHNKERILEVMNGSRITDRKVLLITVSDKAFEEVVS